MNIKQLNYDQIASQYNQRYPSSQTWERGQALLNLAKQVHAQTLLEVGSGTGFWLNSLHQITSGLYGLDYSTGMLKEARQRPAPLKLARGEGIHLPYKDSTFDLVFCVDAIHHFGNHRAFISEAHRILKPKGALAIVGHDPHEGTTNWYVYNYFDTVFDTDLNRYPAGRSVLKWMAEEGYADISVQTVEHIRNVHVDDAVLKDPFIKHDATSQLALLNGEQYQAGIQKITEALAKAKAKNERIVFSADIQVKMFVGFKP